MSARLNKSAFILLLTMGLLLMTGWDHQLAQSVQLRYASERWVHRAALRRSAAREL